jgi:hypothetical protein
MRVYTSIVIETQECVNKLNISQTIHQKGGEAYTTPSAHSHADCLVQHITMPMHRIVQKMQQ